MKNIAQNRFLVLIIIVLLVSNITTIATIIYLHQNEDVDSIETTKEGVQEQLPRGLFFKEKLGLTDDQHELFRSLHQNYNRTTRKITNELANQRQLMVDELGTAQPDTALLHSTAHEIGDLHNQLKELTIAYYLDMKNYCSDEQKQLLHQTFNELLNKDGNVSLPQRGFQRRWGQQ